MEAHGLPSQETSANLVVELLLHKLVDTLAASDECNAIGPQDKEKLGFLDFWIVYEDGFTKGLRRGLSQCIDVDAR